MSAGAERREVTSMKIAVTGGAGFIGGNLCRSLARRPDVDEVVVIDDFSTGSPENLRDLDVTLKRGSILDSDLLDDAFADVAAVVHLAARPSVPRSLADPMASHQSNATGTLQVLEAARRSDAYVVVASSSSVYGRNTSLPKHEGLLPMPVSPYAVSKLATESYAIAYQHCFGVPTLALRFFNVFGPGQTAGHAYAAVIPSFLAAALAGEPVVVYGDGQQTRDFTFVDSVTDVLCAAALGRVSSDGPVNLAFGTRTSLLQLIAELEQVLGRPVPVRHEAARPGDVRDSEADHSRLQALFPEARPEPLRSGLERTIEWFLSVPVFDGSTGLPVDPASQDLR
jgi:UDP-glucose 4-epimerase